MAVMLKVKAIVQGFGNVGSAAAFYLAEAKINWNY
jgi:glutamate dehydrogenase/leucine dehydrogenase